MHSVVITDSRLWSIGQILFIIEIWYPRISYYNRIQVCPCDRQTDTTAKCWEKLNMCNSCDNDRFHGSASSFSLGCHHRATIIVLVTIGKRRNFYSLLVQVLRCPCTRLKQYKICEHWKLFYSPTGEVKTCGYVCCLAALLGFDDHRLRLIINIVTICSSSYSRQKLTGFSH